MTEYANHIELPHEVLSFSVLIGRHVDEYLSTIAAYREQPRSGGGRPSERPLLAEFHGRVEQLVIDYARAEIPPRGDELIFAHLYEEAVATAGDGPDSERAALTALLAAETEYRGPRRLSSTQSVRIADTYECLGHILIEERLPAHAALAFKRATSLFGLDEDFGAQDRCRLARARAKRLATFPAWRRTPGYISDLLCGYGFRPFLLLAWIAAQLVVFTGALWAAEPESLSTSLHMTLINYLNPLGLGDLEGIGTVGRVILIVEAWTGTVLMSVFFALLVRKWFRI